MLLGIAEKRENSFIQAVNEMSFVIPFHGHHVEGRGGPELQPPRLHWLRQGCCWLHLFLFFFFWKRGKCLKASPCGHPFPSGGPAEPRCPPTLHKKPPRAPIPPTPSQFLHEPPRPLAGFTNLSVSGVLDGNWKLINVHLGG